MKKIISILTIMVLMVSSMTCVCAKNDEISVYLDEYQGVNGQKIVFDVPPQTINDRTMVPIRAIFEAMGATVTWDDATKTATAKKDGITVEMILNSTTEWINGAPHAMDVSPVIIDGRTLAPARYVAEAFGYNVGWDQMTKSVLISKNANYDVSQIKDGTREHPYKLGDTVTMTAYSYNDDWSKKEPEATVELTLNSLMSFSEIKKEAPSKTYYLFDDNDWFLKGNIKLVSYSGSDTYTFSDFVYDSKVVTNKLTIFKTYSWYNNPIDYKLLEFYEGGSGDCYIKIDTDKIEDGQTVDYFTITYSSGSSYKDETTVWFSLK